MLKKIGYVLERKQKINIVILLIIMFFGTFLEFLGVSLILPLVNVALDPGCIDSKWYYVAIKNYMGFSNARQMLIFLAVVLIVTYIVKNIYITMMYDMQYRLVYDNQRRLSVKMMKCYMSQDYLFHVSKNVAEFQRNITSDVNGFFTLLLNSLQFAAELSVCIVLVVFLFVQDMMTTLAVAALAVFFGSFLAVIYKKILVRKGEQNREINVQTGKWLLQAFSGIKEIKVANNESFFIHNYENNYKQFALLQRQQSILKFIPRPIMEVVCIGGLLFAFIIKLQFSDADINSFVSTLSLFAVAAFRLLPSFNRITGCLGGIMFDLPSVNAIYEDLREIEDLKRFRMDKEDVSEQIELKENIKIEKLSFRYPETERWILRNADLEIPKNKSIGLIGASGAGKTTLVDIILGLLEPQEGRILVDGNDIRKHMDSWHKSIGYIPQSIYLLDDTIRANIAFGVEDEAVDEESLMAALREAQLEKFVETLPMGLDTQVGEQGMKLSGGQRQRIGIARALYRNPQVLILDEATSALDNETEQEVMAAIDELHGQRTMIVIAHRLTTIKNCDIVYEVGDSAVRERSHQEIFG